MANFSMTCTCGETMTVEAPSRDAAVSMLKAGWTKESIDQHFAEHHKADEPRPTVEQAHGMLEQMVVAA